MGKTTTQRKWGSRYSDLDVRKAERINEWLDANKEATSTSALARRANVAQSTASEILAGHYTASPTKYLNALDDAIKATSLNRPALIPFVETSVYRLTAQVCDRAREFAFTDDIGVLFGVVGVGKTRALQEYTRRHPGTIYLRAFNRMNITVLLNRLVWATDAHLEQQARFRQATNADKLDAVIRALTHSGRMILVDETTRMDKICIETMRDIADDAQVGVVLAGREHLEPMVQDELGRFGEISSRVGFWPPVIRAITEDDCHKIVHSAYGSTPPPDDVTDMYWQCCAGSGRALEKLIPSVQRYCTKHKCQPTPKIVSDAWVRTMRPKKRRVTR